MGWALRADRKWKKKKFENPLITLVFRFRVLFNYTGVQGRNLKLISREKEIEFLSVWHWLIRIDNMYK